MYFLWNLIEYAFYEHLYYKTDVILYYFLLGVLLLMARSLFKKIKVHRKGVQGEKKVKKTLSKLEKKDFVVLHDLLLPLYDGTTQIDHVVIGPHGVTAIETKNYAGRIFGSFNNKYWVQELGRARNEFYNPIKQNETHVKTIKYLLQKEGLHYIDVENLVVFTSRKSKIYLDEVLPVLKVNRLKEWIESHKSKKVIIERVVDALNKHKIDDVSEKKAHVKRIKITHKKRG